MSKCGECTLCCLLLPVVSLDKKANEVCKHCNNGCDIHNENPDECSKFECAYYQMDKVSKDLRPDNCKIIFEKVSGLVFFGTQDSRYELTQIAKNQIIAFNKQGFSVMIIKAGLNKPKVYLAENHTVEQVFNEHKKYLEIN